MGNLDFDGLKRALLERAEELLFEWLPGGEMRGYEFVCGSVKGEPGDSLSYNIRKGCGQDFATGDVYGDMISFYQAIYGGGMMECAIICAKRIGFETGDTSHIKPAPRPKAQAEPKPVHNNPPPGSPEFGHRRYGKPASVHTYRSAGGDPLQWVARYEPQGERKTFIPYTWDGEQFHMKAARVPRPLYGLDLLAMYPEAGVWVVEGEKTCSALRKILGDRGTAITWLGGASSIRSTDWSPLFGRTVLIWPDNDEAGIKAASKISEILIDECPTVKVIDPSSKPLKWDVADEPEWDYSDLTEFIKPRIALIARPKASQSILRDNTKIQRKAPSTPKTTVLDPDTSEDEVNDLPSLAATKRWKLCQMHHTKSGVKCNADNVDRALTNWPDFKDMVWFDEFYNQIFTTWGGDRRPWVDQDTKRLLVMLQRGFEMHQLAESHVYTAVSVHAFNNKRNEVKEWLAGLHWDDIPRLENFFQDCFGVHDGPYCRAVSKNFWLSLVARALNPGCKVDTMVILESKQGQYKSTACDIIGGTWFAEVNESVTSKDFYLSLEGKLLIEIADLDSFSRAETNTIKKVITCRIDRYRAPYGKISQDYPRKCIFIGTTNDVNYLRDHTGARRFWPLKIGEINLDLIRANRSQLYAEAVSRIQAGENWYTMPEKETLSEQESRRHEDAWEGVIKDWLEFKVQTTLIEIAIDCLKIDTNKVEMKTSWRIGRVLQILGWSKKNARIDGGEPQKVWFKTKCDDTV